MSFAREKTQSESAVVPFKYVSGGHGPGNGWRVYRSADGLIGKIVRTRRGRGHGEWAKGKTKFFVWALPDHAPEYDSYADVLKAIEETKQSA